MKKIVVIGGGTGLPKLLRGIKRISDVELSAIVTVADDGSSTGYIREHFSIPALGDLRRVIVALSRDEGALRDLMNYRFKSRSNSSNFDSHSLGNLILTAIVDLEGDFYQGISRISSILNIEGKIIPSTDYADIQLVAKLENGEIVNGESKIGKTGHSKIVELSLKNEELIQTNPEAIYAIQNADLIIFGIGSLYTSVIANVILPDIKKALLSNQSARFVYFGNIMTQPGETDGFDMYDHIRAIEGHVGKELIDTVIVHKGDIDPSTIEKYAAEDQFLVDLPERLYNSHVVIKEANLIDNVDNKITHSVKKIEKVVKQLLEEM